MDLINNLMEFILHIDSHLVELVSKYGIYIYIILFIILFAETGLVIAPFLPGDSLLFAAGALAATGNMNIALLMLVCFVGAVLGNQVNYYIGRYFGPKIFDMNLRFIKKEYLIKTQDFYNKHGGKALIIGRFLPFIRTFVPFIAGVGNMNSSKFTLYNIVGGFTWVFPICIVGYLFGNIPFVKENFSMIILIILIISLIPLFAGIIGGIIKSRSNS
ncbi:MAG: DedA family protein [Saprospiraceae bacterium]|jgi:membrane-associated protein|nr:DedA family protein [Saprospiraceae bacterium]